MLSNNNTFSDNHATYGPGGAIYNLGYATVVDATFTGNTTADSGGAIADVGSIYVTNSVLNANHAHNFGGGFYVVTGAGSWHFDGRWSGNTAGVAGNTFYTPTLVK